MHINTSFIFLVESDDFFQECRLIVFREASDLLTRLTELVETDVKMHLNTTVVVVAEGELWCKHIVMHLGWACDIAILIS